MKQYLTNWGKFLRGIVWLWTREATLFPINDGKDRILVWKRRVNSRGPFPDLDNSIRYDKGWYPLKFLLLCYIPNYMTRMAFGGAIVSWSRWYYLNRNTYRAAKFMDRLLNHVERGHGLQAGPALWGSTECSWAPWGAVAFGASVVAGVVGIIWAIVT